MSIQDKAGLLLIKGSLKHMSKDKIMGLISIVISFEKEDEKNSKEILESVKKEWFKRNYDLKELEDYLVVCRE
jgi:hypothetical protein